MAKSSYSLSPVITSSLLVCTYPPQSPISPLTDISAQDTEAPLTWHTEIAVTSPSLGDHAAWIACLSRTGPANSENPSGNAFTKYTTGITVVDQLTPAAADIDKSLLQVVNDFELHLGSVFLTSGLTNHCPEYNCCLDWALVDLANSRFPADSDTLSNVSNRSFPKTASDTVYRSRRDLFGTTLLPWTFLTAIRTRTSYSR